jgi:hypothetical protein
VSYDISYNSNIAGVFAGYQYWQNATNQLGAGQTTATIAAFIYAQTLTVSVSQNTPVGTTYSATPQVINALLSGGAIASGRIDASWNAFREVSRDNPTAFPTPTGLIRVYPDWSNTTTYDPDYIAVKQIVDAKSLSIAYATTNYIDITFKGGFNYDESICRRDVGLIIDAMSIDLVTNGTYQSVYAGKSYYKNSSARAIAIGTQYSETVDAIIFTKNLALQVLQKIQRSRYQVLVVQDLNPSKSPSIAAINRFSDNMDILLNIIQYGYGAAPTPSFGSGIYTMTVSNGGNGYVDQGSPGNVDIIPAKVLVGIGSSAYASIVSYTPGVSTNVDTITYRLTKPGFFVLNEQLEFGETVPDLQIVIFVESGIYFEDYPIKLPDNVSIKGDEFRRTIIRPLNRISQSPWRKTFFYRDAVIDAMLVGIVDYNTDIACN